MKSMILVFILVASSLLGQVLPELDGISGGEYPLADWVKPGLVADVGFSWINEEAGDGSVNSVIYINGQEVYKATCDPSGLVLSLQYLASGMTLALELEM